MKDTVAVLIIMDLCGLTYCVVREHFLVRQLWTWSEAQQYCKQRFDDLSTVTSQEEINSLPVAAPLPCPNNTNSTLYYKMCQAGDWIGIYTDSNNLTKWSGGDQEPFCAPALQTVKYGTGMCGVVWNAVDLCIPAPCAWNLSFYCMLRFDVILVKQNMKWEEALRYCRNNYIDLVSLTSKFWMNEAVHIGLAAQAGHVWTGLRFLNGNWFWTTQKGQWYQAWSNEGEPQCPAGNLRCGALAQKQGFWQMRDCKEKLNFLCFRKSQQ